jgi:hypothetical protein
MIELQLHTMATHPPPPPVECGWQVHVCPEQPAKGLHVQVLALQTLSQVQTVSHEQDVTGTQEQTELHAHVPEPGLFSSFCNTLISLSGIFSSADFNILGLLIFAFLMVSFTTSLSFGLFIF